MLTRAEAGLPALAEAPAASSDGSAGRLVPNRPGQLAAAANESAVQQCMAILDEMMSQTHAAPFQRDLHIIRERLNNGDYTTMSELAQSAVSSAAAMVSSAATTVPSAATAACSAGAASAGTNEANSSLFDGFALDMQNTLRESLPLKKHFESCSDAVRKIIEACPVLPQTEPQIEPEATT